MIIYITPVMAVRGGAYGRGWRFVHLFFPLSPQYVMQHIISVVIYRSAGLEQVYKTTCIIQAEGSLKCKSG